MAARRLRACQIIERDILAVIVRPGDCLGKGRLSTFLATFVDQGRHRDVDGTTRQICTLSAQSGPFTSVEAARTAIICA
jgi:hypothetical protein